MPILNVNCFLGKIGRFPMIVPYSCFTAGLMTLGRERSILPTSRNPSGYLKTAALNEGLVPPSGAKVGKHWRGGGSRKTKGYDGIYFLETKPIGLGSSYPKTVRSSTCSNG